jgi:hypothetical protein
MSQSPDRSNREHPRATEAHGHHRGRLVTAQADLDAARDVNLATADRATMALIFERMRGSLADLIRMEREHHPEA